MFHGKHKRLQGATIRQGGPGDRCLYRTVAVRVLPRPQCTSPFRSPADLRVVSLSVTDDYFRAHPPAVAWRCRPRRGERRVRVMGQDEDRRPRRRQWCRRIQPHGESDGEDAHLGDRRSPAGVQNRSPEGRGRRIGLAECSDRGYHPQWPAVFRGDRRRMLRALSGPPRPSSSGVRMRHRPLRRRASVRADVSG